MARTDAGLPVRVLPTERFSEVAAVVTFEYGSTDLGSDTITEAANNEKQVEVGDFDEDGDLDVVIAVAQSDFGARRNKLYRNDGGNANDWLRVRVRGTVSNRDGVGTWITVTPVAGGPSQVRETSAGSNFLGQNEPTEHFGLGQGSEPVARVEIRWQSGHTATFLDVPRNSTLIAIE